MCLAIVAVVRFNGVFTAATTSLRRGIVFHGAAAFTENIGAGAELGSSEFFAAAERGCRAAKAEVCFGVVLVAAAFVKNRCAGAELGTREIMAAAERGCRAAKAEVCFGVVLVAAAKRDCRDAA
jgi:hypothetical protein